MSSTERPARKKAKKKTARAAGRRTAPARKKTTKKTTTKKSPGGKKVAKKKVAAGKKSARKKTPRKKTAAKKTAGKKKTAARKTSKKKTTTRKKAPIGASSRSRNAPKRGTARQPESIDAARHYGASAGTVDAPESRADRGATNGRHGQPGWLDRFRDFVKRLYDVDNS